MSLGGGSVEIYLTVLNVTNMAMPGSNPSSFGIDGQITLK